MGRAAMLLDSRGPISVFPGVRVSADRSGKLGWMDLLWLLFLGGLALLPPVREAHKQLILLAIRILFFFLAAMVVNRFAMENNRQTRRYQMLAEQLARTNRELEQVQAQARRSERLAALGQLSAGLAHEIRNPLGIIKGSAEMLMQRLSKSEPLASELAGYISSEVNRLSDLVARFLDFARPLRLEMRPASLTEVLD